MSHYVPEHAVVNTWVFLQMWASFFVPRSKILDLIFLGVEFGI